MSERIADKECVRLAHRLAELTGEPVEVAVRAAVLARLEQLRPHPGTVLARAVKATGRPVAAHPALDDYPAA